MRGRAALVVFAFATSLAAVLVTPWCSRDRVLEPARWVAAVRASRLVQPGVVVIVHPPWRLDVARALPDVATTALAPRHGEPLPHAPAGVVVVSDGSAPLPAAWRARVIDVDERDGLTLSRLRTRAGAQPGRGAAARSLLDDIASARVELRSKGAVVPCPWQALPQRHVCAGMPEWLHIGVEQLPVGGKTVRCAWAHPKTDAALVIRFDGEHLLGVLELSLALTDGAAANASAAPVHALVRIDGVEAARVTRSPGARGFVSERVITGAPRDATVEIELTTPDDGQRHACFQLETRAAP